MVALSLSRADDWAELISDYLLEVKANKKPKTHQGYSRQLRLFERWITAQRVPLASFRAKHLNAFLVEREQNSVGNRTRRLDAILVKMLINYACREGHFTGSNPLKDYTIPRVIVEEQYCPTVEDLRKLFKAVEARFNPATNPKIRYVRAKERRFYRLRDMAILTGLTETALRIQELLSLEMDDVDTEKMQLLVRESKGNTFRYVPFSSDWLQHVLEWRKVRPRCESKCLFVSAYGDPLNANGFGQSFRFYREIAGLTERMHLHSLRHYAITTLAETDVLAANQIAGHKSLATTKGYTHTNEEHKRRKHAEAAPLSKILVNKRTEAQKEAAKRKKLI